MKTSNIFKFLVAGAFVCGVAFNSSATEDSQISCKNASLVRNYDELVATMQVDLSDLKLKKDQAVMLTPMIVTEQDTMALPGMVIYGRTRWYQHERGRFLPFLKKSTESVRYYENMEPVKFSQVVEYEPWMNGSNLILQRTDYGCANCKAPEIYEPMLLAQYLQVEYEPNFKYMAAVAEEVKTRELTGRAYVDFPVNLTTIYPDYRRNSVELAKIIATIDSVRNDKDITVKSLSIKGFASPEGPYDNNIRLAKGRTEALKNYVQQLYSFPFNFIQTSYEPEDWEGLREYVVSSTLPHRFEILQIIDSNLAPDPKNTKIQTDFPAEYEFLLQTVYPGLRHSDYRIEYVIRGFTDIGEIAEIMRTQPSKLSLNEMYLLAQTMEPGSPEYNQVMETAVMMYPNDQVAIINAAQSAMQRGDYAQAERYLNRAGNNAEALYARGLLAGMQKDYGKGIWMMEQAARLGHPAAQQQLEQLRIAKQFAK